MVLWCLINIRSQQTNVMKVLGLFPSVQVIKFEGCYHGHADGFLVQAGSGVATLGLPDSPGVPKGATAGFSVP